MVGHNFGVTRFCAPFPVMSVHTPDPLPLGLHQPFARAGLRVAVAATPS